jgi:hypothetical protein
MKQPMGILIVFALISMGLVAGPARAQQDDGFSQFYADFQNAVKADDKEKIAGMTKFSYFTWEEIYGLRDVKTKEGFLTSYDRLFTRKIKNIIAQGKPEKNADGDYRLTWRTKEKTYSLAFDREMDGSYRFVGLTALQ